MDVEYVSAFFCACVVLCLVMGLAMRWSPSERSYRLCKIKRMSNQHLCEFPSTGTREKNLYRFIPDYVPHCVENIWERALSRIFGWKREKIIEGWIKHHNKELNNFYSSPNIIIKFKSMITRLEWTMASMGKGGLHEGFWWLNQKKRDLIVDGRIIKKEKSQRTIPIDRAIAAGQRS
jgi:hypothetical protein